MGQDRPLNLTESVGEVIDQATEYMARSAYDSAGHILNEAFAQTNVAYTDLDLYYLLSYEAENMYYNALFDQGLNSAYRSLELAEAMRNDTLIGNIENILGLFLINLDKYDEALVHFRRAILLIPTDHTHDYLSYRYQVLANAGECFLKKHMPDSAFHYARLGLEEAHARGKVRGEAIISWMLAEAWLDKGGFDSSMVNSRNGLALVESTAHRDLVLTLYTTMMKCSNAAGKSDSVYHWMDKGMMELQNPLNTDNARSEFLEAASDICISLKALDRGADLVRRWKQLQKNLIDKQQNQRLGILKDYYEKNQRLVLAQEQDLAQKNQIRLRNTSAVILGILSVVLVILIAIFFVYYRQRQRISKLEYKEQLRKNEIAYELRALENRMAAVSAERDRIASDLHDDIGASLSSIRIYSGAAQKRFHDQPEEAVRLIELINQSSSGIMDRMSDIVWAINPKNDNVESIVFRMKSQAGEMFSLLDIQVEYHIEPDTENIQPTMMARRNIYLIFKEAINNIAKYSKASEVSVTLKIVGQSLVLSMADNGVGFEIDAAIGGNGLSTMRRRAESLHGKLILHAAPGKGTRLELEVQIAKISDSHVS
jgi:signal transduction histidine kinase/Tfp pilus assembly protein PilF